MWRTILLVPATAALLVALALPALAQGEGDLGQQQPAAAAAEAMLVLQGPPGSQVSGSCSVGDEAPQQISGQLPQSVTFDLKGKPLNCKISSEGSAAVQVNFTAMGDNNQVRAVQRISGGSLNLTYNNGSISTVASSS